MANKLELTWVGKDDKIDIEPRILIEKPELGYSYSQAKKHGQISIDEVSNADGIYDNMLIHGDNLLALKALEQEYAGKVKCIYIDPPYNTGSAFEHYDDNLEHSTWLSLMKPRLEILKNLLNEEGSIWISIDDDEQAYLKILCDEVFGRNNFINNIIWQKKYSPQNDAKWFSDSHDFIMVYAKNKMEWRPNLLPRTSEMNDRYKNLDNDPRGVWKTSDLSVRRVTPKDIYEIITPSGRKVYPPEGRSWGVSKENFEMLLSDNRLWFGKEKNSVPQLKRFLTNVKDGITALTIWTYQEVGHNQDAKKEIKAFNFDTVFDTPKPERLIERIMTLGSNPGDLVLDSFLGSGTTAAVAHKMGRRWIGIEMGEHAYTHCKVRLDKVVSGEDQGGISKTQNWKGGGGYKFYELAPSLILKDKYGREIINPVYNADMLAAAMAKQEGCVYCPSAECYWKQAKSTENAYLYTTTQHLTREYLEEIASDLKDDEHLIIACKSFEPSLERAYKTITIKKIPNILLDRCEFGKSDYKLNVVDMPVMETEEDDE